MTRPSILLLSLASMGLGFLAGTEHGAARVQAQVAECQTARAECSDVLARAAVVVERCREAIGARR
jgi:hypothetical protein